VSCTTQQHVRLRKPVWVVCTDMPC
jgi:hypothetical protein